MPDIPSIRSSRLQVAVRVIQMPLHRLAEFIHDRLFDHQDTVGIRVYFHPHIKQGERPLLVSKLQEALEALRETDPENAMYFFSHFKKLYVIPGKVLGATCTGMPKLARDVVLNNASHLLASLLVQFVPTARFGLIRCQYQLIDPVPVCIAQRELALAFLRRRERFDKETIAYIPILETDLASLRAQL